jgi:hypothetical protein
MPAMAWILRPAQKQKSFGSFLQKRTFLPCLVDDALRVGALCPHQDAGYDVF